ncbi:MAG: Energy-coupling factor transporter ATP-binding protein EcfA2 [Promethearchaeota archaeon]|nr:MAG: Energy-coupling factor transporter ATP-binding protein EcfA2 [Candidatus Lokiarchaeota archaeon]
MVISITEALPIIMINNVDYTYKSGTKALRGIKLNIYKSELVSIMGQNGAGKTTLIRTLNGLLRPNNGNIYIEGENIQNKNIAQLSKDVGIIFQNPEHQLFANTVKQEIEFSLKSFDLTKEERDQKVQNILEEFNFKRYEERSPLNLSGGEKKKLALASIISRDPQILVFDEPTLGQDAKEIKFFINLIEKERQKGKTIIIITHNIEFALNFIPRTILMARGKILGDGPTRKILTNLSLVQQSSLILPQITQFKKNLEEIGLNVPEDLHSREDMVKYLSNIIKTNRKR